MKNPGIILFIIALVLLSSCESEQARQQRLQKAEQIRIERLKQEEMEQKQKEIFNAYIDNSLNTGATPYASCFGGNPQCSAFGCSQIIVRTPSNSDVLVTIKNSGQVVRHAYIRASSSYEFELPNGTYQPFFYYGKGWYPEKEMQGSSGCQIKGGFISDEVYGKDDPQHLANDILTYELILQANGNFSTRPSNAGEAF